MMRLSGSPVSFFFSSRRRHTRFDCDWSSDVCSSDLFQIISIFHALTVFENVRIAAQAKHRCRFAMLADAGSFADLNAEALEFLRAVGLGDRAFEIADTLSHGDQRLLEIAIPLATRPELLLLDEPLAGLAAHERLRVADLIRTLRRSVTIVLIEHDIDAVLA